MPLKVLSAVWRCRGFYRKSVRSLFHPRDGASLLCAVCLSSFHHKDVNMVASLLLLQAFPTHFLMDYWMFIHREICKGIFSSFLSAFQCSMSSVSELWEPRAQPFIPETWKHSQWGHFQDFIQQALVRAILNLC